MGRTEATDEKTNRILVGQDANWKTKVGYRITDCLFAILCRRRRSVGRHLGHRHAVVEGMGIDGPPTGFRRLPPYEKMAVTSLVKMGNGLMSDAFIINLDQPCLIIMAGSSADTQRRCTEWTLTPLLQTRGIDQARQNHGVGMLMPNHTTTPCIRAGQHMDLPGQMVTVTVIPQAKIQILQSMMTGITGNNDQRLVARVVVVGHGTSSSFSRSAAIAKAPIQNSKPC